jgi:hypothetical protein
MIPAFLAALTLLAATPPPDLPVEQRKQNIKVLQGLPSSQLIPVMAFMSNSLGVTCAHCHAKNFDSDEKPAKDAARKMIALQRAINEQHFGGKLTVTCNTCHQGRVIPPATPDVANSAWNAKPAPHVEETFIGEEILTRLPVTPKDVMERVIRGVVERDNGRDGPKSAPFTLTIDGSEVQYDTELSHPPEASRAFVLYLLQRPRLEQIAGERWSFGANTILRMRETPTPIGNLPEAIDYSDFRHRDVGRLPFRVQWSRADYRVTSPSMRFVETEHRPHRKYPRSNARYCTASATCAALSFSSAARSAIVRATFRMRSCARAESPRRSMAEMSRRRDGASSSQTRCRWRVVISALH